VVRDPLRDISKQFQSLTGDIKKVIEQQALTQQQEQQGDLETLWGQFNETIHSLKADLQLRDEYYQERITTLEQEVSRLNTELITTNKPPSQATQPS
jgi:chromosome segregation ATPase